MVTPHARKKALNLLDEKKSLQDKIDRVTAQADQEDKEIKEQIEDIRSSISRTEDEILVADHDAWYTELQIKTLEHDLEEARKKLADINTAKEHLTLYLADRKHLLVDAAAVQEKNADREGSPHRYLKVLLPKIEKVDRRLQLHLARNPGADTEEAQEKVTIGGISGQIIPEQKNLMDIVEQELAHA